MKYNELLRKSGSSDYINSSHILKQMLIKAVSYNQLKLLKSITCETLIIWGKNDDTTNKIIYFCGAPSALYMRGKAIRAEMILHIGPAAASIASRL